VQRLLGTVLLGLSVCAAACGGGAKEQEFSATDAQAIRQVSGNLATAFNAKDLDKILALYTDNSVFMPPNKPLLRGRDSLKGFYNGLIAGGSHDLKITVDDVVGHGPLGYESGTYEMMNGTVHDRGKFLFVLRNMSGNWKIEYTSWSSDLPPTLP
jgi:ketosteroid isomerase-like protein